MGESLGEETAGLVAALTHRPGLTQSAWPAAVLGCGQGL